MNNIDHTADIIEEQAARLVDEWFAKEGITIEAPNLKLFQRTIEGARNRYKKNNLTEVWIRILVVGNTTVCHCPAINQYGVLSIGQPVSEEYFGNIPVHFIEFIDATKKDIRQTWLSSIWEDLCTSRTMIIWSIVLIFLTIPVFLILNYQDIQGYFKTVVQIFALILTLYTLSISISASTTNVLWQLTTGALYKRLQSDRFIGFTAVMCIFTCLAGIVLSSASFEALPGDVTTWLYFFRGVIIIVAIALHLLLLLFFYSIINYYSDRRRNDSFINARKEWIEHGVITIESGHQ